MHPYMFHSQECPELDLASKYKEMLPDKYPSSFYLKCISSCFAENMSKVIITYDYTNNCAWEICMKDGERPGLMEKNNFIRRLNFYDAKEYFSDF